METDNNNVNEQQQQPTGGAENVLQDRDVSITTTDTQKLTIPTEENVDATDEDKDKEEGKAGEEKEVDEAEADAELQEEVDKTNAAVKDLRSDLSSKNIDFDEIAEEFLDTGDFSQAHRDALAKAGYPDTVVDAFISGLRATAAQMVSTVYSYCGGEDEYNKLTQFIASQGDGSIEQFNRVVETGDLGQIKLALDGFKARMGKRTGVAGRSVLGGNGGTNVSNGGFTSKNEMVKAMSDPRYGRDPAYTKDIQRKTMDSSFF